MRNFFVLMPSFENYGGHEFTFIKPLNFFAKEKKIKFSLFITKK